MSCHRRWSPSTGTVTRGMPPAAAVAYADSIIPVSPLSLVIASISRVTFQLMLLVRIFLALYLLHNVAVVLMMKCTEYHYIADPNTKKLATCLHRCVRAAGLRPSQRPKLTRARCRRKSGNITGETCTAECAQFALPIPRSSISTAPAMLCTYKPNKCQILYNQPSRHGIQLRVLVTHQVMVARCSK